VRVGEVETRLLFSRVPIAGELIDLSYYDAAQSRFSCATLFVNFVVWRPSEGTADALLSCTCADPRLEAAV
jgi:hypothetical protein